MTAKQNDSEANDSEANDSEANDSVANDLKNVPRAGFINRKH